MRFHPNRSVNFKTAFVQQSAHKYKTYSHTQNVYKKDVDFHEYFSLKNIKQSSELAEDLSAGVVFPDVLGS